LEVGPRGDFDLEAEAERLEKRLRFLATLARLWNIASRVEETPSAQTVERLQQWLKRARHNEHELLALLDAIHAHAIPEPPGSYDSMVEFDQRRVLKERLLSVTIATCLDTTLAVGALRGILAPLTPGSSPPSVGEGQGGTRPPWEPVLIQLELAL